MPGPFSAGQLLERLARKAPEVGRATVFRTLQLLCEARLLERVQLPNGQEAYVAGHARGHHHHLFCTSCGQVQELDRCAVEAVAARLAEERGFVAQRHTFEIYGLCPRCQA